MFAMIKENDISLHISFDIQDIPWLQKIKKIHHMYN